METKKEVDIESLAENVFQETLEGKKEVVKMLNETTHNSEFWNDSEMKIVKALAAWLGVNILVGNDLCPPNTIHKYIEK